MAPVRVIEGGKTRLARTSHSIAFDEVNDEIVIPNSFAEAILFFRGGAEGDEAPIRIIQGPHSQFHKCIPLNLILSKCSAGQAVSVRLCGKDLLPTEGKKSVLHLIDDVKLVIQRV